MINIQGNRPVRVYIESGGKAGISILCDKLHEKPFLVRMFPVKKEDSVSVFHSGWLVECTGKEISVYCTQKKDPGQYIQISFDKQQEPSIRLIVEASEYSFSRVQRVEILEHQVRAVLSDEDGDLGTEAERQRESIDGRRKDTLSENITDIVLLSEHLRELKKREQKINELLLQTQKQAEDIGKLKILVTANLEDMVKNLDDDLQILSEDGNKAVGRLYEKLNRRAGYLSKIADIEEDIRSAENEILSLRKIQDTRNAELVQKNGIIEALKTDNERIMSLKSSIESFVVQINLDQETVEALEDSTYLRDNRLGDTIEDIGRKIKAAERRIGMIIRFQEMAEGKINSAVLNKLGLNERIRLEDETGIYHEANDQTELPTTDLDADD